MSGSRFNFENSNIGDGNVFGDNSSSNVQIVGRDEFKAQLLKLRAATNDAGLDDALRNQVLQQLNEADAEAQKPKPNTTLIQRCLEKAQEIATDALGIAATEVVLVPLFTHVLSVLPHLFS